MNFWKKLPKPFFVLAPMEDVTDTVFRQTLFSAGRPDVFFTEFTNSDGLLSKGGDQVGLRLKFAKKEKPIVAQIWSVNSDTMEKAAKIVSEMGFDGIDINMGCPQRNIIRQGAGGALIDNQELASKLIKSTLSGAGGLPVSIKTRTGVNHDKTEDWISFLLRFNLAAITLHARTVKDMSKVPARWDEITKAVNIRNKLNKKTLIIGNGDINSRNQADNYIKKYKCDGIMIGRAIMQNPYLFSKKKLLHGKKDLISLCIKHLRLFNKTWAGKKPYKVMKKYFKIYIRKFEGAGEVRSKLMDTETVDQALFILESRLEDSR